MDKQLLRKEMRQKRKLFQGEQRKLAEDAINMYIYEEFWSRGFEHKGVMGYLPIQGEVDISPVLDALEKRGVQIYLPRVMDVRAGLMGAVKLPVPWREHVVEGFYGILEPVPLPSDANILNISLVLVPGVAFDRNLNRLGFGGGFYDRFLPRLSTQARKLGVAFECQFVDTIPVEPHDCLLDAVFTEKGVYYI